MTHLSALARAALPATAADNVVKVFRTLTRTWTGLTREVAGSYRSEIADDGAPFEFCVATGKDSTEVQFYVEPRPATPTDEYARWRLGALLDELAEAYALPLDRLRAVERLFIPEMKPQSFALWIGASFVADKAPQFKVYLNPCVHGASSVPASCTFEFPLDTLGSTWALFEGDFAGLLRASSAGTELEESSAIADLEAGSYAALAT